MFIYYVQESARIFLYAKESVGPRSSKMTKIHIHVSIKNLSYVKSPFDGLIESETNDNGLPKRCYSKFGYTSFLEEYANQFAHE
jgi:hypothetical protein